MIRLGSSGIPGGDGDPFAFARAHRAFGYGAVRDEIYKVGDAVGSGFVNRTAAVRAA